MSTPLSPPVDMGRITTFAPVDGRRKFKGVIEAAEDGNVSVRVDGDVYELAFDNIASGRLVPDYDALMASSKK